MRAAASTPANADRPGSADGPGLLPTQSPARARAGITERLASASSRRPWRTVAAWGGAVIACLVLTFTMLHGLSSSGYVIGTTQSAQADALYSKALGGAAAHQPTDVIVLSSSNATVADARFRAAASQLANRVAAMPGVASVRLDLRRGSPLVSANGHAALIDLRVASDSDIKPVVQAVRAANGRDGMAAAVTGAHTLGRDFSTMSSTDLRRGEIDFGLPIALVILILVFGAVVAGLTPVVMAVISIAVGMGIASALSRAFSLSVFIVEMMVGMGLALGIDYALFVISRFREERGRGFTTSEAVRRSSATAGRAVLFSGSTFVVALLGIFLVPTNIMRSLAAGAIIVGVVSVAAALTLLPAVLTIMGDRINALRLPLVSKNLGRADASEARIWRSVIGRVMRHPGISLALAAGFMALLAVPVLGLHIGQSGVATLPDSAMSKQGYLAVSHYFRGQDPNPVEIVAVRGRPAARADLAKLATILAHDPRFGAGTVRASAHGSIQTLTVPIRGDATSNADVAAVRDLRGRLIPEAFAGSGAKVLVGGTTAVTADYFHAVTTPTPYVLLFVLGVSFLLLLVAFRSLTAALLSVALNLLAVGAAYGLLTLVFIHGAGAGIFGFQHVDAIDAWVPLFLFSVLFALSMDYQVFLMSRIKEDYDHSGSTRDAVINGVSSTARIITGAALIIVVVFSGFARGQLVMFQQMGFGVAAALLLDATVVRMVILPSALGLLGRRSWYLPRWLNWLPQLEVEAPPVSAARP
jgi:putative drug exporter of the RND superfamily